MGRGKEILTEKYKMSEKKLTGYDLSRSWFNYLWEHPGEITANDTALFFWLVEIWNRIGQPEQFQITAKECKDGMSAKSYNTYKKSLDKLIGLGYLKMIRQSTNQYQCNVIAMSNNDTSHDKALSKAFNKARAKAPETFIKPLTLNQEPITLNFKADKPPKTPKDIIHDHLFSESPFFEKEKFYSEFIGSPYENCNLDFYYEAVKNWSASAKGDKGKKTDWIATARNFMLGDKKKNQLQLKNGASIKEKKSNGNFDLNNYHDLVRSAAKS